MAEAHDLVAPFDHRPHHGVDAGGRVGEVEDLRPADLVEQGEGAARRATVQRTARARRRRRRRTRPMSAPVEATTRAVNVDALKPWSIVEIRYRSTAQTCSSAGAVALQHPQVVGRPPQLWVGRDGRPAGRQPVQRAQHGGCDGAEQQRVAATLAGVEVDGRSHAAAGRHERERGAQALHRTAREGDRGQHGDDAGRQRPQGCDLRGEDVPLGLARPGGRRRSAGARRPRAVDARPARSPSTGGSGRSPRCRGRRRPRCRPPPRPSALGAPPADRSRPPA